MCRFLKITKYVVLHHSTLAHRRQWGLGLLGFPQNLVQFLASNQALEKDIFEPFFKKICF